MLSMAYIANQKKPKAQGIPAGNSLTFSFHEYAAEYHVEEEAGVVLRYFMAAYKETFGKDHMKLKPVTWQEVADTLFSVYDEYFNRTLEIYPEDLENMIDHYFLKQYQDGCNYCVTHFNSPRVKKINYFETADL